MNSKEYIIINPAAGGYQEQSKASTHDAQKLTR